MAAVALAACAAALPAAAPQRVPGNGFLRILPEGARPAKVEVGGESRPVVDAAATTPRTEVVAGPGGVVSLAPGNLPPLRRGALGYRIAHRFADPSPLKRTKRTAYMFLPIDGAEAAPIALVPPGVPEPTAVYRVREVLPVSRRLVSPPFVVPDEAALSWAVGLRQDWRVSPEAGASFTLALERDGCWHVLDQVTTRVADTEESGAGWIPREADLDAFTGSVARLHFITERVGGAPTPQFAEALWAAPILHVPDPPAPPRGPNVILICLDTVRRDRLGVYGYARGTSPNLDAFATEAVVFDQAIAPAPWTTPTHASVFTGYHPDVHRAGVLSAGYHLAQEWTTLAEVLRDTGRLTAAFTEGIAIRGAMGFAQGFEVYSDGPSPEAHVKERAPVTFGNALAWLEEFGHLPHFLFVQTYEAHAPYGAPEVFARRFIREDLALDPRPVLAEHAQTPEERRRVSDLYDASIAYTDDQLGVFLDGVRALGLLDNTVVILFSDHGEEFWEHGAAGHLTHVYDEVIRVPLVVRMPGGAFAGTRVESQVDLTDLFATVLELAERVPPPDTDSLSLLPLITGRGEYRRESVVSVLVNTSADVTAPDGMPAEWRRAAHRTPEQKYIRSDRETHVDGAPPVERLYDLKADPGETRDRAAEAPNARDAARAQLDRFEAEKAEARVRRGKGDGASTGGLTSDDIEALQSLGYL